MKTLRIMLPVDVPVEKNDCMRCEIHESCDFSLRKCCLAAREAAKTHQPTIDRETGCIMYRGFDCWEEREEDDSAPIVYCAQDLNELGVGVGPTLLKFDRYNLFQAIDTHLDKGKPK